MEKEKWINEVLASTNGILPSSPNDGFYERTCLKLETNIIIKPTVYTNWGIAAALFWAVINFGSIYLVTANNQTINPRQIENTSVSEIQTIPTYDF